MQITDMKGSRASRGVKTGHAEGKQQDMESSLVNEQRGEMNSMGMEGAAGW